MRKWGLIFSYCEILNKTKDMRKATKTKAKSNIKKGDKCK